MNIKQWNLEEKLEQKWICFELKILRDNINSHRITITVKVTKEISSVIHDLILGILKLFKRWDFKWEKVWLIYSCYNNMKIHQIWCLWTQSRLLHNTLKIILKSTRWKWWWWMTKRRVNASHGRRKSIQLHNLSFTLIKSNLKLFFVCNNNWIPSFTSQLSSHLTL